MEEIKKSVFAGSVGKKGARRCFVCVARAEQLGVDHDSFSGLCREVFSCGCIGEAFHLYAPGHPPDRRDLCDKVHGICTDIVFRRSTKKRN